MVETPTGKLLRVTDTYAERIQVEAFFGNVDKAEAERGYCTWISQLRVSFCHGPPHNPLQLSTAEEEAGSRERLHLSQLKHLINRCYLKRLVLPPVAESVQPLCFTFVWSCPAALPLSFHTVNSCRQYNMQKNYIAMGGKRSFWFAIHLFSSPP